MKDYNYFIQSVDFAALRTKIQAQIKKDNGLSEIDISYQMNLLFSIELLRLYHEWMNE